MSVRPRARFWRLYIRCIRLSFAALERPHHECDMLGKLVQQLILAYNVSEQGDKMHRRMHCSLRKELRCMHSLFERGWPGHASLFDRGLVSLVRRRKPAPNYRA